MGSRLRLSLDETAERNTIDGEVVGPRFFIAPELDEGGAVNVTPAADIYSLGQLIFYMLTGGNRVARENVLDSRYAHFFAKGPRHELLRLLLSKMVAPLATRYTAMDVVLRGIEQIEDWEQAAAGGLLDSRGLAATGKLQKRMAEEIQQKAAIDETRAQDIERIKNVSASVAEWLLTLLKATCAQISAGDVLIARGRHCSAAPASSRYR
jgi:serine/threonine protein kinase